MKTRFHDPAALCGLCFLGLALPLHAGSLTQPAAFSASNEDVPYSGSGAASLVDAGAFSATFDPFPASLGTLTAFTVRCEIEGRLDGFVDEFAESGSASGSLGGTFLISGIAFNGAGGNEGIGGGPGDPLEVGFGIPAFEQTLAVADAGALYDPALLAAITGSESFTFSFTSGVQVTYSNVATLGAEVDARLSVTFHYLPADGGPASEITLTSLSRDPASGEITLEWSSPEEKSCALDASDNLLDWTVIAPELESGPELRQFVDQGLADSVGRRFYRLRERP